MNASWNGIIVVLVLPDGLDAYLVGGRHPTVATVRPFDVTNAGERHMVTYHEEPLCSCQVQYAMARCVRLLLVVVEGHRPIRSLQGKDIVVRDVAPYEAGLAPTLDQIREVTE